MKDLDLKYPRSLTLNHVKEIHRSNLRTTNKQSYNHQITKYRGLGNFPLKYLLSGQSCNALFGFLISELSVSSPSPFPDMLTAALIPIFSLFAHFMTNLTFGINHSF